VFVAPASWVFEFVGESVALVPDVVLLASASAVDELVDLGKGSKEKV
jgi:hypothetical protein